MSSNDAQNIQALDQGTPSFAKALKEVFRRLSSNMHTAMPGQVVKSYDDGTADIQPLIIPLDNLGAPQPYPTVTKVPVFYLGPDNGWLRFPLTSDTTGILLFAERSIENWVVEGGQQEPSDSRRFSISDGMFLPGLRAVPEAITPKGDPTSLELAFGPAWLEITAAGLFKMKNGTQSLGPILDNLITTLQGIKVDVTTAPGVALLDASIVAQLATVKANLDQILA